MKRTVAMLLALVLALSLAPTLSFTSGEVTVVKILAAAHTQEIHQLLADQFNATHDNIKIEVDGSASGWDGVSTKLITMLSGGEEVDIATVSTSYYPQFAALGQLLDITEHAEATYSKDEYYWSVIDGLRREDGKLYGMPMSVYTLLNYFNKSVYDANNYPYPSTKWGKDAWTYEDWKKVAYDLSSGEGIDRIYGAYIEYQLERTAAFLFPEGLNYWGEDLTPQFDNARIREIHEELYKMLHVDKVIPDPSMVDTTGIVQIFADGKAANFITGTWNHASIFNSGVKFGVSATPGGVTVSYVDVYIPLKNTKHPEATLEVLDYLNSYDATMVKYANNALGPQVNKKATIDSAENSFAGLTAEERQCVFDALDNSRPLTVFPEWAEFLSNSLLPASSLMCYGEYTVEEGFNQLQEEALAILGR